MTEATRKALTPQQYIHQLFTDTKDGVLNITYYPYNGEPPYTLTYAMDWTEEDAEEMVRRYEALTKVLDKSGTEPLTTEEQDVWDTYARPFDPFEVDLSVIDELYLRGEYDSLDDDENALLERHFWWRERQCLERLPFLRRSPTDMIVRAQRYAKLAEWKAPELVIREEGRCLAEEIVLYYCGPQETQTCEEEDSSWN